MTLFKGKRESVTVYLFDLVLLVWFLEIVFPPLNTLPIKRAPVCLACAFASIFLYLIIRIRRTGSLPVKVMLVLFIYFLMIILPYLARNGVIGNRYMALSLVFFGPIIFEFYRENGLLGHLKTILYLVGAFALVTGFITFFNLLNDSFISRSIKSGGEYTEDIERSGIGGYQFIYFVASVCLPLLYVFLTEKKKKLKKYAFLLIYAFCLLLIVKSNYMTAFVTALFCSLLLVFLHVTQRRGTKGRFVMLLVLAVFFVIVLNMDKLLMQLEGFFPKRIAEVLYSGEEESLLQSIFTEFKVDRWPTIAESLRSFADHPFLGLCFSGRMTYNREGFLVGFGQHSFIADTLALYGFLFGFVCIWIVFRAVRLYPRDRVNALSWAMILCVFMLYFFNNATESIALSVGIVYPLVRELKRESLPEQQPEQEGMPLPAYPEGEEA